MAEPTETREEASPEADGACASEAGAEAVQRGSIADAIPTVVPSYPIAPPDSPETTLAEPIQSTDAADGAVATPQPHPEPAPPLPAAAWAVEGVAAELVEPPPPEPGPATAPDASAVCEEHAGALAEPSGGAAEAFAVRTVEHPSEPIAPGNAEPDASAVQEDQAEPPAEATHLASEVPGAQSVEQPPPVPVEARPAEADAPLLPDAPELPPRDPDPPPAQALPEAQVPEEPSPAAGAREEIALLAVAGLGAQAAADHLAVVRAEAVQPAAVAPSSPSVAPPSEDGLTRALPYLRLALKAAAAVVLGLAALVVALIVLYRWVDPPTSALMLAQRLGGTEIEQSWVPLRRISPQLVRAVVLSEDGGFCRHRGVDWRALEEAMETARGGSTITMQLVKNLFLWPSRSYVRKAIEIALAYLVEALWPKERILEVYLNIAEWGDGVFGAEAAARHHFGRSATQLTVQEAALLAVSLPNPIERQAGTPGPGARRLASNLLVRMKAAPAATSCVLVRRGGS